MTDSHRYDVVVVGAGPAGIAVALEASRRARVLLLEKDSRVGGALHSSGGHLSAAGTRRQAAVGIDDDCNRHFADVMRISRGTCRTDLVRRAVDLAPGTLDWLDDHGFDHAPETPRIVHGHEPYTVPRTHIGRDGGLSVLSVLRPLLDAAVAAGRVDLHTSTAVTGLRTDTSGRVTGVTVWGSGPDESFEAGVVVLATGGFAADPELFAEIEGVPLVSAAHPTATGDGLHMARELGAAIAGQGTYLPTFGGLPHPTTPGRAQWSERVVVATADRKPWEIYVERDGHRFLAEDEPSIDAKERALAAVADLTFWMVLDDEGRRQSPPVAAWTPETLQAAAGRRVGVHRADTLEQLARIVGIDPAGLLSSVTAYNEAIATGQPDPVGREFRPAPIATPPFFALENHGISLISFAGVDVDGELRVRRADGTTIEGLYAVGELLGAGATCGNSFCGGMLLTPALSLGRWLGGRLVSEAGADAQP